jgi:hypothetical protein
MPATRGLQRCTALSRAWRAPTENRGTAVARMARSCKKWGHGRDVDEPEPEPDEP